MRHLILLVLLAVCLVSKAQPVSCLSDFENFTPIRLENDPNIKYSFLTEISSVEWFTDQCILIGGRAGLWLYDLRGDGVQLAYNSYVENVIAADSKIIFYPLFDNNLYLIETDNGVQFSVIKTREEAITATAISPDGQLLAVSSSYYDGENFAVYMDGDVQVWNLETQAQVFDLPDIAGLSLDLFFPDNQHLLTFTADMAIPQSQRIKYWQVGEHQSIWSYPEILSSTRTPYLFSLPLDMNNNFLAVGGIYDWRDFDEFSGSAVYIWDVENPEHIQQIIVNNRDDVRAGQQLFDIKFNHDGSRITTVFNDGLVQVWNVRDGKKISEFDAFEKFSGTIDLNSELGLLTIADEGELTIWNIEKGALVRTIHLRE